MERRTSRPPTSGKIVISCENSKIQISSEMITDHPAVQDPGPMGRVMEEATPVQDSKAIRVDMAIKAIRATRVVITNRDRSSSSQGTKVTQSS